jgi:hypothetical protein
MFLLIVQYQPSEEPAVLAVRESQTLMTNWYSVWAILSTPAVFTGMNSRKVEFGMCHCEEMQLSPGIWKPL